MSYRLEHDTLGEVRVPQDAYYGAQTARSLLHFEIGEYRMPPAVIHAFGALKWAAAEVNARLLPTRMTGEKKAALQAAAEEVEAGRLDAHFPLVVFQTGSGTQTNMNANEVIANRGNEQVGKALLHPNDDVNMSQSSNDTFPTAMAIAAVCEVEARLLPAAKLLIATLREKEEEFCGLVKAGRTHLQDATPIAFSQEISGWRASLEKDCAAIAAGLAAMRQLAIGGTAVGTGINAPQGFGEAVAAVLTERLATPFYSAKNKFSALTSLSAFVTSHATLKALATDLYKIANDIRLLASGPRCGLGELTLPANEPGSSIMPGKVNPTQCEAVTMVTAQVLAADTAIGFAAAGGQLELNVFLPVTVYNYLTSVRLLADCMRSFATHAVKGMKANREKMESNLYNSLMTATALSPHIGYERAAALVALAHREGITLREANHALGYLSDEKFDRLYHPEEMI